MRSGKVGAKFREREGAHKRKWPKEVPLGEHTSLGPKSYCPDYRNLPVT